MEPLERTLGITNASPTEAKQKEAFKSKEERKQSKEKPTQNITDKSAELR